MIFVKLKFCPHLYVVESKLKNKHKNAQIADFYNYYKYLKYHQTLATRRGERLPHSIKKKLTTKSLNLRNIKQKLQAYYKYYYKSNYNLTIRYVNSIRHAECQYYNCIYCLQITRDQEIFHSSLRQTEHSFFLLAFASSHSEVGGEV